MPHFYKIYILNSARRITFAYEFVGPDDLGAIQEAKKHSDNHDVEVWHGARIVARMARESKAAES